MSISTSKRAHYLAHKAEYVARAKRWKAANRAKVLRSKRAYYQRTRAAHAVASREWWQNHPELLAAKKRRAKARARQRLAGSYVRNLLRDDGKIGGRAGARRYLTGLPLPAELVEAKRWHLKLKRALA